MNMTAQIFFVATAYEFRVDNNFRLGRYRIYPRYRNLKPSELNFLSIRDPLIFKYLK